MKVIFKKVPFLATMTMYCHLTTEMDGSMIHGKTRKEEGCPGTGGTHLIKNGELYSVLMLSVESTGYQLGTVKWEFPVGQTSYSLAADGCPSGSLVAAVNETFREMDRAETAQIGVTLSFNRDKRFI
jgi:hypothetical protein